MQFSFHLTLHLHFLLCVCVSGNAKRTVNFLPSAPSLNEKLCGGNKFKTVAMDTLSEIQELNHWLYMDHTHTPRPGDLWICIFHIKPLLQTEVQEQKTWIDKPR